MGAGSSRTPEPGWRPADLLITGGGGKLGATLERRARVQGLEVEAPDLDRLDVTDPAAVRAALEGTGARWIVHAAARTDVDACEKDPQGTFLVNATGAGVVAGETRRAGAHLLHLSTDFVFAGDLERPLREEDPTGPAGVYARSKEEAEREVRRGCPDSVILRTSWLHGGPGADFPRKLLPRLLRDEPVRAVTDQVGSPTYVGDLADAILALLALPPPSLPRLVHFANRGEASRYEWALQIAREVGSRSEVSRAATGEFPGAPRPAYSPLDCSLFHSLTGVSPRHWQETVLATIIDSMRYTSITEPVPGGKSA